MNLGFYTCWPCVFGEINLFGIGFPHLYNYNSSTNFTGRLCPLNDRVPPVAWYILRKCALLLSMFKGSFVFQIIYILWAYQLSRKKGNQSIHMFFKKLCRECRTWIRPWKMRACLSRWEQEQRYRGRTHMCVQKSQLKDEGLEDLLESYTG